MHFFDNKYLMQYIEMKAPLNVYVDSQWFTIADADDLDNDTYGVGYDRNGRPHTFDYRTIEQIKAAGKFLSIDDLAKLSGEEPMGDDGAAPDGEGGGGIGAATDLEGPDNVGGGGEDGDDADASGEAPSDDEEPEPPSESARRVVGQMIMESKLKKSIEKYGIAVGDFVENVDVTCACAGSRGAITDIIPSTDDGVPQVEYRVFNMGYNFKPGQKVIKSFSVLRKVENK